MVEGADRLSDGDVQLRLSRLDELLAGLEQLPGPGGERALDAVATLTAVYGEALARVMSLVSGRPELADRLGADELVGHLLVLHGISPTTVEQRVAQALAEVRPYVQSHGGDVELVEVRHDVARIRISKARTGCGSTAASLEQMISDAVLTLAPELTGVTAETPEPAGPAVIPVDQLFQRIPVSL